MIKRLAIVGVGLIGGSLALALRRRGLAKEIIGIDSSTAVLTEARRAGAVDDTSNELESGVRGAEMVVLATPVQTAIELLPRLATGCLAPGTVITDVGSTKGEICRQAALLLPPDVFFVGGHPLAGSENSGFAAADPYLFENAFYVITPLPGTPPTAVGKVRTLAEGVGGRVIEMNPEEHDRAVAYVSHLPHLLAATLVNTLGRTRGGSDYLVLAAGGFRDTTRVAAGGPALWRDIFLTNRKWLLEAIACFKAELERIEADISAEKGDDIYNFLARAREVRRQLPAKVKGYLPPLYEIVAAIPDRPGELAEVAGLLAASGINITDVEILRVREGEGGSIRFAFATEREQQEALTVLRRAGYSVMIRA